MKKAKDETMNFINYAQPFCWMWKISMLKVTYFALIIWAQNTHLFWKSEVDFEYSKNNVGFLVFAVVTMLLFVADHLEIWEVRNSELDMSTLNCFVFMPTLHDPYRILTSRRLFAPPGRYPIPTISLIVPAATACARSSRPAPVSLLNAA